MISDGRHMTGHKDPGLGAARENRFAVDFEIKAGRPGPLFGERFMRSLVVGRHAFLANFIQSSNKRRKSQVKVE